MWRLLQHLGGFDRDVSGDPNFKDAVIAQALGVPMELQHADVIKYMAGQKLDFARAASTRTPTSATCWPAG